MRTVHKEQAPMYNYYIDMVHMMLHTFSRSIPFYCMKYPHYSTTFAPFQLIYPIKFPLLAYTCPFSVDTKTQ
jgi:hypothetical protein